MKTLNYIIHLIMFAVNPIFGWDRPEPLPPRGPSPIPPAPLPRPSVSDVLSFNLAVGRLVMAL